MSEKELEDEYVTDRCGTVWRAIEVFKIGEMQGTHNERLRIIKLIEENMDHWDGWLDVKALIEGEQK